MIDMAVLFSLRFTSFQLLVGGSGGSGGDHLALRRYIARPLNKNAFAEYVWMAAKQADTAPSSHHFIVGKWWKIESICFVSIGLGFMAIHKTFLEQLTCKL